MNNCTNRYLLPDTGCCALPDTACCAMAWQACNDTVWLTTSGNISPKMFKITKLHKNVSSFCYKRIVHSLLTLS